MRSTAERAWCGFGVQPPKIFVFFARFHAPKHDLILNLSFNKLIANKKRYEIRPLITHLGNYYHIIIESIIITTTLLIL